MVFDSLCFVLCNLGFWMDAWPDYVGNTEWESK
jgi:hypothetical protein